jgi:hypothetical protein
LPHWFGPAGNQPVEILSIDSSPGQRMHVRAASRFTVPGPRSREHPPSEVARADSSDGCS